MEEKQEPTSIAMEVLKYSKEQNKQSNDVDAHDNKVWWYFVK